MQKEKSNYFGMKKEIINPLVISKLQYNDTIFPNPPGDIIKQINGLVFNFVWNGKDRMKRNTVTVTIIGKKGGRNIIDVES